MADRFFAVQYFDGKFVEAIIELSSSNKFFSNRWLPYISVDMIASNSSI